MKKQHAPDVGIMRLDVNYETPRFFTLKCISSTTHTCVGWTIYTVALCGAVGIMVTIHGAVKTLCIQITLKLVFTILEYQLKLKRTFKLCYHKDFLETHTQLSHIKISGILLLLGIFVHSKSNQLSHLSQQTHSPPSSG